MLPATAPPTRADAALANASLLETDASDTENADALNGISAATVRREKRTMVVL